MTYSLPEVLEPDDFGCVKIYYPKHAGYLRAVLSAISYLQRWYAWERDDAHGGKTAAAKFREAYGLTVNSILAGEGCDSVPDSEPIPICKIEDLLIRATGTPSAEGDDDDMGQVVTDVTIENGKLVVWFGPCCSKILGDATVLKDTTDLSEQLPEEYQPENYAGDISCQKAHAMTVHLWRMAELLCQTPTFDEGMGSDLKSAYADISFDQLDLIGAYLGWVASEILFLGWSVNDTDFKTIRCKLNAVFTDRWSITSDEFKAMKAVVDGNLSLEKAAIFHGIIDAVGPGDWNKLALQAAMTAQSVDCLCPDQEFSPVYDFPTGTTWAYLFDFAVDDYSEWWSLYNQAANVGYVPGVGYKMTGVPYDLAVLQLDAYCTDEDSTTGLNYVKVFLDERPTGGSEVRWGNTLHVNSVDTIQDLALPMALTWEYRAPPPGLGFPFESVFLYRSYTIKGEQNVSGNMVIRAVVLSGVGTPPMAGAPAILT